MNIERLITAIAAMVIVTIAGLYSFGLQTHLPFYATPPIPVRAESAVHTLAGEGQRDMLADRQMLADYQATMHMFHGSHQPTPRMRHGQSDMLVDRQMLADYQASIPLYWVGSDMAMHAPAFTE